MGGPIIAGKFVDRLPRVSPTDNLASANHMRKLLLTALACGVSACAPAGPPKVSPTPQYGMMEFPAPYSFSQWWSAVEQCSGLRGDLESIRWYLAPRPLLTLPDDPGTYAGMYFPGERRIVLGLFEPSDSAVVGHEMLHALIDLNGLRTGDNQHPAHYFRELCGKVVLTPFGS